MTVNLIPQDELTLNLLAEVLAKMYRYSLSRKNDAPASKAGEPGASAPSDVGQSDQRQGYTTPERDLAQAETR